MKLTWDGKREATEQQFEAIKKIIDNTNYCLTKNENGEYKPSLELIQEAIDRDVITENQCRNGREVIWYLDESKECCIYVDTLDELSQEEIEKELL